MAVCVMTARVLGSIVVFLFFIAPAWPQEGEILNAHNRYRAEVGVPPLAWSGDLANEAQQWANYLASRGGKLVHSSQQGEGENLCSGTSGHYNFTQMVDSWGHEKRNFVNGNFPRVSKTGNWAKVGHYTQIIWRNTQQGGCAGVDARGNYIFVCRYRPPGNYKGQRAF
jgi:hypothetical protein